MDWNEFIAYWKSSYGRVHHSDDLRAVAFTLLYKVNDDVPEAKLAREFLDADSNFRQALVEAGVMVKPPKE